MNTPVGALRRSSPKVTLTAPRGNCSMTFFLRMEKWCPATPAGAILPYSSFGTCLRIAANATSRQPSEPGGVGAASGRGGTLPEANGFASESTGDVESAGAENGPGDV